MGTFIKVVLSQSLEKINENNEFLKNPKVVELFSKTFKDIIGDKNKYDEKVSIITTPYIMNDEKNDMKKMFCFIVNKLKNEIGDIQILIKIKNTNRNLETGIFVFALPESEYGRFKNNEATMIMLSFPKDELLYSGEKITFDCDVMYQEWANKEDEQYLYYQG